MTLMSMYEEKLALYRAYMLELDGFRETPAFTDDADVIADFEAYINSSECSWHNVFDNGELVGFLIMGKSGRFVHPDSIRSVREAYVLPDHRGKHLLRDVLGDYMTRHKGVYSLLVLRRNQFALRFWPTCFKSLGYRPCALSTDCIRSNGDDLILMGFEPIESASEG